MSFASLVLWTNKKLFWWYYRRVPVFFHQWTFFRSVNLLIQNYEHLDSWHIRREKFLGTVIQHNTELEDKIRNMQFALMNVDPNIVKDLNKMFGLNFPHKRDN